MATITSLGFNISSNWDGRGVREARNDLRMLTEDMRRISGASLAINVDLDTAAARAQIAAIREDLDNTVGIDFNIDEGSYAVAEARIQALTRDRTINIHTDTHGSVAGLAMLAQAFDQSSHSAARSAAQIIITHRMWAIAIAAMLAGILLLPPALSLVGAALTTGLVGAMAIAAGFIVAQNAEIKAAWEHLANDAKTIFTEAGAVLVDEFSRAIDMVHDRMWEMQGTFNRAFAAMQQYIEPLTDALLDFSQSAIGGMVDNLENAAPVMDGFNAGLRVFGVSVGNSFRNLIAGAEGFGHAWVVTFREVGVWLEITTAAMSRMAMDGAIVWDGLLQAFNRVWGGIMDGLAGFMDSAAGPFRESWIAFGDALGGFLRVVLPAFGELASVLATLLIPVFRELGGPVGNLVAGFLRGLKEALEFVAPLVEPLAYGFGRILEFLGPMGPILGTTAAAWWALNIAMNANPFVLLATTIAGLAAGIVYLAEKTTFFQDTWAKFAPDSLKNFFDGGADGVSRFDGVLGKLKETWDNVWGAIQRGLDNLGKLFGPQLQEIWTAIKEGFGNAWADISSALGDLGDAIGPLMTELKPILSWIMGAVIAVGSTFLSVVGNVIKPAIQTLGDLFAALIKVIRGVVEWITGMLRTVKGVFEIMMGFIDIVVGIFTGSNDRTTNGLKMLKQGWEDFTVGVAGAIKGLLTVIRGTWDAIVGVIRGAAGMIWGVVSGIVEGIVDFFKWLFDVLVGNSIIPDLVNSIVNFFTSLPGRLWGILTGLVEGVIGFFSDMASRVLSTVSGWMQGIWNTIQSVGESIKAVWSAVWNAIQAAAQAVWDFLRSAWDAAISAIKQIWDFYAGIIRGAWDATWNGIKAIAEAVWNGLKAAWDAILSAIKQIWDFYAGIIRGAWDAVWNGIKAVAEAIWNGLKAAWDAFLTGVKSMWDTISGAISNAWNATWNAIKTTAETIWNTIRGLWESFTGTIQSVLQGAIDFVRTKWDEIWNWFSEKATGVWDGVKRGFSEFRTKVEETIEGLVGKVKEIWERITGIFDAPITGIKKIWNGVAGVFGLDGFPGLAEGGPVEMATGGGVRGPGTGTSDSVPAWLSNGEHVWTAKEVQAAGGHDEVEKLRQNVLKGKGFAAGGAVEWMWARVQEMNQGMQLTSSYRNSNDYHGQGKAIDVSNGTDSTPQMQNVARRIADTWGKATLELIHSPFNTNIKDGRSVGDGMGFYGAGTMAQHRNHVHWAVNGPLDGSPGAPVPGGGFSSGPSQEQIDAHKRAVAEIKRVIDDTNRTSASLSWASDSAKRAGKAYSGYSKQKVMKSNLGYVYPAGDTHAAGTHGSGLGAIAKLDAALASASAAVGGVIPEGERRRLIEEAMGLTNTPPPNTRDNWLAGMNTLITRESNWNPGAINDWDSNARAGYPTKGLTQMRDDTFQSHAVPGHNNIFAAVDNIASSINYIKSKYGDISNVQQANANMPPRGYAGGTMNAKPGWAIVGENGPEAVKFRGGEAVHTFNEIVTELKNAASAEANQLGTKLHSEIEASIRKVVEELKAGNTDMQGIFKAEIERLITSMHADAVAGAQRLQVGIEDALERVLAEAGINVQLPLQLPNGSSPEAYAQAVAQQLLPQLEMMIRQRVGAK